MSKIKVRAGGQVKIPAKIAVKYRLHEGDILKYVTRVAQFCLFRRR
jgi:bifunctional DNA-binding transcriptional regulator/antitoxin component of YhaV-PrlF toxin-antitoxin module